MNVKDVLAWLDIERVIARRMRDDASNRCDYVNAVLYQERSLVLADVMRFVNGEQERGRI